MSGTEIVNARNAVGKEAYRLITLLVVVIMQLVGMLIMVSVFVTLAISTGLTVILVLLQSGLRHMWGAKNMIDYHLYTTK